MPRTTDHPSLTPEEAALYCLCRDKVGPALVAYVHFVLTEARRRGIRTLYFLARDGQILLEIARRLCEREKIDVDCRYLYCSRRSLRLPSYHLLGEEAYDLLFADSRNMCLEEVMNRASFSETQKQDVLTELHLPREDARKPFLPGDAPLWRRRLQQSQAFPLLLEENSRQVFEAATAYFRQEGLYDQPCAALVDSGWAGSSQRSLRQLMQAGGYEGTFAGFYFGLIRDPQEAADGEYIPWRFARRKNYWAKVMFNLNVFECLLAAPHGMTRSYVLDEGQAAPELAPPPSAEEIRRITVKNEGILAALDHARPGDPCWEKEALRRLHRFMVRPEAGEARSLGAFRFSDDIGTDNQNQLVSEAQLKAVRASFVPVRLWRKVTRSRKADAFRPFWAYGTVALIPGRVRRWWYRANILLWEMLKYLG